MVVIMADYDGCFDCLFRFSPAVAGQTVDTAKEDESDLSRYSFVTNNTEDQEQIDALRAWLIKKTCNAATMFYCGSNRQSKVAAERPASSLLRRPCAA